MIPEEIVQVWSDHSFVLVFVLICVCATAPFLYLARSVRPARSYAAILCAIALSASFVIAMIKNIDAEYALKEFPSTRIWCPVLFWPYLIAFVALLYHKWLLGNLSVEESTPGRTGLRAWLALPRILICVVIAASGWSGYGYSLWGILALTLAALAVYPLALLVRPEAAPPPPIREDLSAERARVLAMLEAGKINAEECSELLSALGGTTRPESRPSGPLTSARALLLLGVVLLVFGFFLPWMKFDNVADMARASGWSQVALLQLSEAVRMATGQPDEALRKGLLSVNGGGMTHGMGWVVVIMGVTVGAAPFLQPSIKRRTMLVGSLILLGGGAFLLAYLASQSVRSVGIGLVLTTVAYVVLFLGTLREYRPS